MLKMQKGKKDMAAPRIEEAILSEVWKITKITPPFYVRFKAVPHKDLCITKVVLTQNNIFLYEKDSEGLDSGHLPILKIGEKFISYFERL